MKAQPTQKGGTAFFIRVRGSITRSRMANALLDFSGEDIAALDGLTRAKAIRLARRYVAAYGYAGEPENIVYGEYDDSVTEAVDAATARLFPDLIDPPKP